MCIRDRLTADPDADAGTHNGHEDLTHDAGSAQTNQAEHDAAYKTAQKMCIRDRRPKAKAPTASATEVLNLR